MKEQTPAEIIYGQLGRQALAMMGAKDFFSDDDGDSLVFKIRGCKRINFIKIKYNHGCDLYRIEFKKYGSIKNPTISIIESFDEVYSDSMHEIIEETTGLYLSL